MKKLLLIVCLMIPISGCATAQETLDLSEEVTSEGLWFLVATDVTISAFIEHLETLEAEAVLPVEFKDGTTQRLVLKRDDAIAKLKEIQEKIAPLRDGLTRLNTSIQKGSTFLEFLNQLKDGVSAEDLVKKFLPGVRTEVETLLPEEE